MNIDDNGNSYAEMRTVTFARNESGVPGSQDADDGYAQLPVIVNDAEGKEFMVHFADDRDMENIENMDEEVELGVDSDDLKVSFHHDNDGDEAHDEARRGNPIPDQERFLPIANVSRVMKRMIPSSGKIAKDAKECVQECVSEFISFITSEANDKCLSEKRKTISADDLLEAIANMGFDNYVAPLQLFLERYRAAHKLNSIFPNSSIPRFSSASEGCSASMDGEDSEACTAREYSSRGATGLSSTASATTVGGPASHAYQSATTSHGTNELHSGTNNSSSNNTPIVLAGGIGGMPVTALHQQPMQIYVDPASKQHYMAIETDQGMQLYPIQIQTDGPVAYTITSEVATSMTPGSNESQTFIMMAAGEVEDGHVNTVSGEPSSTMGTTASNGSSARSSTSNARTNNHDFNNRQNAKNTTASTTFIAAPSTQCEEHIQTRTSGKRQPGLGKNGAGKVVASTKRPRHS